MREDEHMNRVSCTHCGKQFKTQSGLDYHLGWAHDDPDSKLIRQLEKPYRGYVLNDSSLLSPEQEAQLLGQIQEELGRLQVHANEDHLAEAIDDCTGCHEILQHIAQRCAVEVAGAIFSIPGIREANAFNDRATARNSDVLSWFDIPGVKEAVEKHQVDDDDADFNRACEAPYTGRY